MALSRRSPFGLLKDLERQLEDNLPSDEGGSNGSSLTSWSPKVDVYEESDNIVFELEAPGVDKDNIDISIEDNRLTVQGERSEENVDTDSREYYRSERFYGSFKRSFALPDAIDTENVSASHDNGVLRVTLPKVEQSRRKSIEIE